MKYPQILKLQRVRGLLLLAILAQLLGCSEVSTTNPRRMSKAKYLSLKDQTMNNITEVLNDNLDRFRWCYQKHRNKMARDGSITLVFLVLPDGATQRVGVAESELPIKFKACLVKALWSLRFPPNETGQSLKVSQPLAF